MVNIIKQRLNWRESNQAIYNPIFTFRWLFIHKYRFSRLENRKSALLIMEIPNEKRSKNKIVFSKGKKFMPLQWRQLPPNRFRPRRRIHTGRKKKYKPSPPHIQLVQYKLLKMCKRPGYLIHPRYGRVLKKPIHEWTSDDVAFFRPFVNRFGKILPRVKTILSVKQHRIVSNLIRRARYEKKIPFRISKMKKVGRYPIRRDMKSLRLYNKRRMILSKALADGRITSTES